MASRRVQVKNAVNAKTTQAHLTTAPRESAIALRKWHRENCVKELYDRVILEGHAFKDMAVSMTKSTPLVGRMRKLLGQISSLSTDLPKGIYVRHRESRLDVLKVLIIGPADTPYENGLFEFDMFCGLEFPNRPPKMLFRTTGGGQARFNPNLYHDGQISIQAPGSFNLHQNIIEPASSFTVHLEPPPPPATISPQDPLSDIPSFLPPQDPLSDIPSFLAGSANIMPMPPGRARANEAPPAPPKDDDPIWGEIIRRHFE
ncbi:ubiquitin-conjugating enzyme/RWD-like protein [Chaetomium strumarium]|uniref:Ubiquitin-conjugating enzyme/RWD-like protein n=1 Tax=Chaetomium strumarium TaxID=1170767 RepID=A0AAJ0GV36_9PEZI|nr:ubiquitin-conjugating enzyme/RWD-like protein [Chaetomium strumarium]